MVRSKHSIQLWFGASQGAKHKRRETRMVAGGLWACAMPILLLVASNVFMTLA